MPKPRPWTIASHRPLAPLADDLWHVEADLDMLPIGRRMVVARLATGDLVVHNAVACDDATMTALDALGPVRWIVVPSHHHRMDAHAFATRYPDARVVAPAGSADKVAKVCRVDGTLDTLPADPSLRWEPLAGIAAEVVFIHHDRAGAATLVFNDAFMNLPAKLPGFKGFVVKLLGSTGGPKVTRTAKFFIIDDKRAYANRLRELAQTPNLARIVVGHGANITADAGPILTAAAGTV